MLVVSRDYGALSMLFAGVRFDAPQHWRLLSRDVCLEAGPCMKVVLCFNHLMQ